MILYPCQNWAKNYPLEKIVSGLTRPLYVTSARDGSDLLYVVEQDGLIKTLKNGKIQKEPFLNIEKQVRAGGERGLLGLAFHPDFKKNGKFYVNYTFQKNTLKTRIAEFTISKRATRALPATERVILEVDQPYSNHNGGQIEFGPEGYLYIGVGDGGSGGDPHGHGQNRNTLLGSILRIDVNHPKTYGIPRDNPFSGQKNMKQEIWAYGLRNPWRFSFDRKTGRLFAADVGQDQWEEIDLIEKGKNYGWNIMEGNHCYSLNCPMAGLALPMDEYGHDQGYSVTGGYVYRGQKIKSLYGYYIYGDYGSGRIWAIHYDGKRVVEKKLLMDTTLAISSFGEDAVGELYVVDHQGTVYLLKESQSAP